MSHIGFDIKNSLPVLIVIQILVTIVDIFLWGCLLPIVLPVGIFFYIYKSILLFFVSKYRKDLTPIGSNDLLVARNTIDKKEIVDIGFVLQVNGDVSLDQIREKFRSHFLSSENDPEDPFKTLYCTFEMLGGYLFFKRVDKLLVDKHMREDILRDEESPQSYFSTWHHSPYHDNKAPRWELLLLKSLTKNVSYVGFRMHHGLIDGYGMLMIEDKLCDQESPYLVKAEPPLSFYNKLSLGFKIPRRGLEFLYTAFTSKTPFPEMTNVDKTNKMLISWATMDISALKSIRRQLKVSFSTLLYVLQTGALRRHLIETGRKTEITERLPVFHTIPRANHPRPRFANHWSSVKLYTPFANENPLERVLETEELVKDYLSKKMHIMSIEIFPEFLNLLPTRFCILNLQTPLSVYKAALSTMVRADSQYFLFGKEVTNIYHIFCTKDLCPQTVLYTSTASHTNQMDVTLVASKQLVPTQEEMNRMAEIHFQNELQDLINRFLC